jgi:hypothetical protein
MDLAAVPGSYWKSLESGRWLPGTDYSALRAAAARRRRTGLSMSAVRINAAGRGWPASVLKNREMWLPGTDSNRRPTD